MFPNLFDCVSEKMCVNSSYTLREMILKLLAGIPTIYLCGRNSHEWGDEKGILGTWLFLWCDIHQRVGPVSSLGVTGILT